MKKILVLMLAFVMLAGCAAKSVAQVGSQKITEGEFKFYLSSIKEQMKGTELQTDEDWETREIEGEKAIDVAKQRAIDNAVKNVEYGEIAKLAGLSLSDEELKTAESTKARIIASHGGNSGYKKYLKDNGITDKFIDMMCHSTVYYSKIANFVEEKYTITEEGLKARFDGYKAGYAKAKHILFLTVDPQTMTPLSQAEIEEAKKRADDVYKRIESGEKFDGLMNEFSEDPGLSSNPDGYVFKIGEGEMMAEFEQAVASLSFDKGQELTMAETAYGYHIITRLEVTFEDLRDEIRTAVLDELVEEQISEWETEFNFKITKNEELLKKIK